MNTEIKTPMDIFEVINADKIIISKLMPYNPVEPNEHGTTTKYVKLSRNFYVRLIENISYNNNNGSDISVVDWETVRSEVMKVYNSDDKDTFLTVSNNRWEIEKFREQIKREVFDKLLEIKDIYEKL